MILPSGSALAWFALYAALTVVGVYTAVMCALMVREIIRGRARIARNTASLALREELQKELFGYLTGSSTDAAVRRYLKVDRKAVVEALFQFQATVRGDSRDRLCALALDLGLVHEWYQRDAVSSDAMRRRLALERLAFACIYEPCRRVAGETMVHALDDPDDEVRLSAARGVAQTGQRGDLKRVLALAIGPNRLMSAVLAGELRRHAVLISTEMMPALLGSGDAATVKGALHILVAWERAVPIEALGPLLVNKDREIRALALRLAPLASPDAVSRIAILRAITDTDPELRNLAVIAAGRLKMEDAMGDLVLCLKRGNIEIARQAALALAAMPPKGVAALEKLREDPNPITALAAREALLPGAIVGPGV
jgi:hypothetical protein